MGLFSRKKDVVLIEQRYIPVVRDGITIDTAYIRDSDILTVLMRQLALEPVMEDYVAQEYDDSSYGHPRRRLTFRATGPLPLSVEVPQLREGVLHLIREELDRREQARDIEEMTDEIEAWLDLIYPEGAAVPAGGGEGTDAAESTAVEDDVEPTDES